MNGSLAGNRYAKSLMGLAEEKNVLDAVFSDMELISNTVSENPELGLLLKSPIVKTDKKQAILKSVFGDKVSELSSMFLQLISDRNRESLLGDIAFSFLDLYKRRKNIVVAELTSAIKLDDDQKDKILSLLTKEGTTSVEVVEKIDPEIIGGFIVRADDKQIDASIIRALNDLRQEFNKNLYIADF